MKKIFTLAFLLAVSVILAQNPIGIETPPVTVQKASFEKSECITDHQRNEVRQQILANKLEILKNNPRAFKRTGGSPLFISPIRPKAGFEDPGYYIINFQVDHNLTPNGNLTDYDCNERTYDWATGNHEGTDYVLWPYPWKRMQEEVMEIVAAAPGIIIDKRDGNFDMNCNNNGNPLWNGIVVEHSDGSQAWYWHFKDGAITTKNIGDAVDIGEYLGAAGSSGSSSIPHLHFEVYDANNNLVDPYAGPCNQMNTASWWENQPDYFVPTINKISTHNSTNFDADCGEIENNYEELNFLPGDDVVLRIFYRDLLNNSETQIVVKKPDGTILYDYVFASPWPNYTGAWAEWVYETDNTWLDGVYEVTATFNGTETTTQFGINTFLGVDDVGTSNISIHPNPTNSKLMIESSTLINDITLTDLTGRIVLKTSPETMKNEIDLSNLSNGVYMVIIQSEGKRLVKRVIKE